MASYEMDPKSSVFQQTQPPYQQPAYATYTAVPSDNSLLPPPVATSPEQFRPVDPNGPKDDSWLHELLGLLLSVLAFGGVIALFALFDGKALSDWKSSAVSLNTAISIFANTTRVTMLFVIGTCLAQLKWNWFRRRQDRLVTFDRIDEASHGVYGSMQLFICMLKRPHWILLGALTTVILLGFEPFLQALVHYDDGALVLESQAAEIGSCSTLNTGSRVYNLNRGNSKARFTGSDGEEHEMNLFIQPKYRVDLGMPAAVWNGFSDMVSAQNLWPSFSCPSGNCTWDTFASLSVCSSCHDISHLLEKTSAAAKMPTLSSSGKASGPMPDVSNQGFSSQPSGGGTNDTFRYTKYEIPDIKLNISNYDGPAKCTGDGACADTYMVAKMATNPGMTISFTDLQTLIFAIQMVQVDDSWKNNETFWEETEVIARECGVYFCVNAYETQSVKGELVEQVVSTWTNRTPGSFSGDNELDELWTEYNNYTLDFSGHSGDLVRDDLQLYVPATNNQSWAELVGLKFNVTQGTIVSMIDYITGDFNDQGYYKRTNGEIPVRDFNLYPYPSIGYIDPPDFLTALGRSPDVLQSFENTALSLTKWVRDVALRESPLKGQTTQAMVIIRIRWEYLIWPAVTVLAGLVFVALSIWETKRLGMPAWKGSILATLAHGSDLAIKTRLKDAVVLKAREKVAKKMTVRLEYPDGQGNLRLLDDDNTNVTLVR